jgi:DNA-binding NarL/FixJ family response regulator
MYRVLVVEGHPTLRAIIVRSLQATGDIQVVGETSNGPASVVAARELEPDVVVMDVRLPGLEGIDAIRRIKQEMPRVRVVVTSIIDEEDIVLEMFEAGAEAYLDQSISDFSALIDAIYGSAVPSLLA